MARRKTLISSHISPHKTPQTQKLPGRPEMVKNRAGGYVFKLGDWQRLDRFLILGSEGGTYYAGEREMTIENANCVLRCIKEDGLRVVRTIVDISKSGRAPKNDAALLALALCATHGDSETKSAALEALSDVARIGTHLFHFAQFMKDVGHGWGRGYRRAVQNWYLNHPNLTLQTMKYKQRDGWSHRDMLRLAHIKPTSEELNAIFNYMVTGKLSEHIPDQIIAAESLKNYEKGAESEKLAADVILDHKLPWEVVPTHLRNSIVIWDALLQNMPMTAMVRNLAKMTSIGLLKPGACEASKFVEEKLKNEEVIRKSRIHPLQILMALKTYESGHGLRGKLTWTPVRRVLTALDDAFYTAFGNVTPTGKRTLIGLDVSSSMLGWGYLGGVAGIPGLTPAEACAAMCMVTARVEDEFEIMGFAHEFRNLNITERDSLPDVLKKTTRMSFGGTDCSLPMKWAKVHGMKVDAFIVYTDNETWAGRTHVSQAIKTYRKWSGIEDAKFASVATTATDSSLADPNDFNMLDFVGFDTATPNLLSDFIRG